MASATIGAVESGPDPQAVIQYAYGKAVACNRAWYVYSNGRTYTNTKNQPSRFRSHWRVDPDGELWAYCKPDGDASTVPHTIAYERVTE